MVPQADPEALASGIIWTLNNYEKAKEMARKGRAEAEQRLSAEAMIEGNLRVYKKLLAERRE